MTKKEIVKRAKLLLYCWNYLPTFILEAMLEFCYTPGMDSVELAEEVNCKREE